MSVTLLHQDCMEYMAGLPDGAFELAIVDPPYGIGMSSNPVRQSHEKKCWDASPPNAEYFRELRRVSQFQAIWGANHFIEMVPFGSPCWVVWDKQQPHDFTLAGAELAWTNFSSPTKVFRCRPMDADRIHPTQKPVALYRWLLHNYAKPGWRILDTHLGSGSSAIAAHEMGFEFVGLEIDADYIAAARKRFDMMTRQTKLDL